MNYELAVEIGVDLIAPATLAFVILYSLLPWYRSPLGRAMMAHGVGSMLLFCSAVLTQYGILPEEYSGSQTVTLTIIVLWIFGWWYLVWAIGLPWWKRGHQKIRDTTSPNP